MSLQMFADALPDYATDLKRNVAVLLDDRMLGDQRKYGLLVACAHATGYRPIVVAADAEAEGRLSPEAADAARAAAATMAMTNVYYRFVHLASDPDYGRLPSGLRMNRLRDPGIERADVELFGLAVSAMNGCGLCIDSHEAALRRHGISTAIVQAAVRAGAVIQAIATVHATLPARS